PAASRQSAVIESSRFTPAPYATGVSVPCRACNGPTTTQPSRYSHGMAESFVLVESPLGPLLLAAEDGALTLLWMSPLPERGEGEVDARDRAVLAAAGEQLDAYFSGDLTAFDLPLAPSGTPFQQRVWAALVEIPF